MAFTRAIEPRRDLAREITTRIERLAALSVELNKALTLEDVANAVLRHGIKATGAIGGAMALVRSKGSALDRVAAQGEGTNLLFPGKRASMSAHVPLVTAARTAQSLWLPSAEELRSHYPRFAGFLDDDMGIGCVPLARAGIPLGALGFVFKDQHSFGPAERAFIYSLSRNCLDALQRARILDEESEARRGAENAAARLERLQRVTAGLNRALSIPEIADIVVHQALDGTQGRASFLAIWQGGEPKIVAEVGASKEALVHARHVFQRSLPAVEQSREPLWSDSDAKDDSDADPPSSRRCKGSFIYIPIRVEDRLVGVLGVKLGKRRPPQSGRMFLYTLASLCGQAIERARLYELEREARARAEQANRMKDEFLGIVSHELRTPLTAISCWVALLKRRTPKENELERALESISRNTSMQARLVEDLLDTSRIVSDKLSLELEEVSLPALLESARQALTQAASEKGIEIRVVLPENPPPNLRGDSVRLEQVVRNLLSNSIKFTPSGGRVELRLSFGSTWARVEVVDTGEGIAPELLPHVFDRFRQGDGSSSRRHGGLGLGLSIVRYLVEAHRGRVSAHSDGHGKGTKMTVELPIEQDEEGHGEPIIDPKKIPTARTV
ncbi:GAF domain-containing sensor histidine kinase [Polyangium aurulentum]|uniref:GAF domain-containing sensor histidine kinase n=1 Tax=Polyangium aurulentum TaxID=2567896 RepID=UPI0010ADE377|nr:GAF domain-containing sensor histidine kinase [Polyangium aurulentum]UQA62742.1 GAF domain-containing sensor histidine kinase [Polyangium aurulentum]